MQPQLFSTSLVFAEHQMSRTGCPKTHTGLLLGLNERLQPSDSSCFGMGLGLKVGQGFCSGRCKAGFDKARPWHVWQGEGCVLRQFKKVFF